MKMATTIKKMYTAMISSMGVKGLEIPMTAVKFFKQGEDVPAPVMDNYIRDITLTCCQGTKQASLGDAACLTRDNIGCVAAAISLGLVDKDQEMPLDGSRVYTDIMHDQSRLGDNFVPPAPKDFTDGTVYACRDSGRLDFCLFGKEDGGRYRDVKTARLAIDEMIAIQPAITKAVFFYSQDFEDMDLIPDVIVFSVRPVELARMIQAYQYNAGRPVTSSTGAVRVVCSDLIAHPYLTQDVNISSYCLGARLIARYEGNRLGIGMPFVIFEDIVKAMEDSKTGYPFHLYPGAAA
jgi:uncharacterized protein (DUF169 family)